MLYFHFIVKCNLHNSSIQLYSLSFSDMKSSRTWIALMNKKFEWAEDLRKQRIWANREFRKQRILMNKKFEKTENLKEQEIWENKESERTRNLSEQEI